MQCPAAGSPPQEDTSPYLYTFITRERRADWQRTGRPALVEDVLLRVEGEELQELGIFFQEVLQMVTHGLLNPLDAGALIKEILETAPQSEELDLPSFFLDTVTVMLSPLYTSGKEDTGRELGTNQFLQATGIDKKLVCTLLDEKLLIALKIVRGTFDRMGIRHSTNVLYRQSGFNLLREESEGYSKLMTEFFTVTHNFKPDKDTVEKTWEKVKALIGAFDLDVGRVLDITLDAFANNLIKHNKFFIRLLKYSDFWPQSKSLAAFDNDSQGLSTLPPWSNTSYAMLETSSEDADRIAALRHGRDVMFWDRAREVGMQAFFELGGRRALSKEEAAAVLTELSGRDLEYEVDEKTKEKRKKEEDADLWASRTNTFPPQGNSIAAQILGFKLQFYASEARDASDRLGINLIWLAALLIKIGFISLNDLYPHLYPTDDRMDDLKQKLESEKARAKLNSAAANNPLAQAGALSEGEPTSLPINRSLQDPRVGSRTPLRTADTAGATPAGSTPLQASEAAKPELPEPEDQKVVLLRSLLLIGAIPDALYILGRFPWLIDLYDDLPKYLFRVLHHMLRKVYAESQPLRGRPADPEPGNARVEINNTPMLEARQAPRSIAWGQLEKTEWSEGDFGTTYRFYWDEWSDLMPVCETVDDVFTLTDTFINLVGHKIGRDAELLAKLIRIGVKSMRDDTSNTNTLRWQKLAKRLLIPALSLTTADPGIMNEAWALIKSFPIQVRYNIYSEWNMGQISRMPDIKAAFAVTDAQTKDVMRRISKTNLKEMSRSLAKVSYPSPGLALAYGIKSIEAYNNLIDVLIECMRHFTYIGFDVLVWQLLSSLSGTRNRMQEDGMFMSKWLQRLAEFAGKACKRYYKEVDIKPILQYVHDRLKHGDATGLGLLGQMILSMGGIRSDQNWSEEQVIALSGRSTLRDVVLKRVEDKRHEVKRESARLVQALTSTNLAGTFLILIAQERQQYLERPSSSGAPIKVLSTNLTSLQFAFVQYLDFLRNNFSVQDFDTVVPPLEELIGTYHIEPAIAFTIMRPSIQHQIEQANKAQDTSKTQVQSLTNGDVEMKDASGLKPASTLALHRERSTGPSREDTTMGEDSQPGTPAAPISITTNSFNPVLQQVIDRLNRVLEPNFESQMSMPFYVRFWQSSLADLVVGQYDEEVKNARNARNEVNNDRTDMSVKGQKEKATKRADLNKLDKDLQEEWRMAIQHKNLMRKTFTNERLLWFPVEEFGPEKVKNLINAIVQDCILPRIVLSEMDALFSAKYIFMVHKMNTPGFRTYKILARLFSEQQFIATLFMLTEREARNLGIFFKEVLGQLKLWHSNKAVYIKEGAGPNNDNPGFMPITGDGNVVEQDNQKSTPLDHADYQRLLYKWHHQLHQAVLHCLKSTEFMHVRNAIFFVKQVYESFPAVNFHGSRIQDQVQTIAKEDERDDLKLSAASLLGDLTKMKPKWVMIQDFRSGDVATGGPRKSTPSARGQGTPKAALSAEAKEFRPKDPSSSSTKEEEDGEIEDEKDGAREAEPSTSTDADDRKESITSQLQPTVPPSASTSDPTARASPVPSKADLRPVTPATAIGRSESNRTPASQGSLSTLPGGLPPRPQGPIPSHRDLRRRPDTDRPPSRVEPRQEEHHGRPDRPVDFGREPKRHRSRSPTQHSRNRTPEPRYSKADADRREPGFGHGPPRDLLDSRDPRGARIMRDPRDERQMHERELRRNEADAGYGQGYNDPRDRDPRGPEPPARGPGPHVNPDRAAMLPNVGMNPERAALFAQDPERHPDDDRRHRGRRGQSPPRDDPRPPHAGSRGTSPHRVERAGPERPPRPGPRDRRDDGSVPSAPPTEAYRNRNELFPTSSRSTVVEPNHGRLAPAEARPQQDPNYGRLNAPAAPDSAPSGPRARANQPRGGRAGPEPTTMPAGPRVMPSTPSTTLASSSPGQDRAPPSGPGGSTRRPALPQPTTTPTNAHAGSAGDAGATGIHPSRLQNIPQVPPVQTNPPSGPVNSSTIPSGPRSGGPRSMPTQNNAPAASPTGRFPPTGPASGGTVRGGRSQIGLINGVLQDQQVPRNPGTTIRGRASIGGASGQGSAPQSPTILIPPQPTQQSMPPPGPSSRPELPADRVEQAKSGTDDQGSTRRSSGGGARDEGSGRRRHGRSRSRSPRREATDNAMRQSGDIPHRNGPSRDEGSRRRDGSDRDGNHRDRRSRGGDGSGHGRDRERDRPPRDNREPRAPSRNEGRPLMGTPGAPPGQFGGQGAPPPPLTPHFGGPNGDMIGGPGGRRDGRDRRDDGGRTGGPGSSGRDAGKRRRPDEGPPGMHDHKRPRRTQ
jgi:THO complex subunit 2